MKATIQREEYSDKQVLGSFTLTDGDTELFSCKTLELPWRNNQSRVSCIPTGNYRAVFRDENQGSGKYGNHYHIQEVGGGEVNGRSFILIHNGNHYWHIKGCVLVGMAHVDINNDGYKDVTGSKPTMAKLVEVVGEAGFDLEIKGEQPDYSTLSSENPVQEFVEGDAVVINASSLNIRSEASGSAPTVAPPLERGTKLEIVESENGWALVKMLGHSIKGWVSGDFVDAAGSIGEVTSTLNIRSAPSGSAEKVTDPLPKGTKVNIKQMQDNWLEVEVEAVEGFVASAYLKKA